ncbi:hypothetical protein E4T52_02477 [Aureobasidium sp. EXF-3400]|nr:hypothetical protein E4T51_03210 [Aureobasidium sp. EXF-12344]KAI4782594.1 hypothetical protein E4T52_02477 [Aureobasidium sp. EXF-3400]
MTASSALPPEIFRRILSLVAREEVARCARVCKTWCEHATSLLYEHIDLTWRRPMIICEQSWDNMQPDTCPCELIGICTPHREVNHATRRHRSILYNCLRKMPCAEELWPSLYLLARTIVSSPSIARLVRHFRLVGSVPRSIWTDPHQTALSLDDLYHIRPILQCNAQMSTSGWLHRLEHGCPSAFAALVLICLPELQTIELGPGFQDALPIIGFDLLQQKLPHVLQASVGIFGETVRMGSGRAPYAQADAFFQLLLLRLPQIQSLALNLPRPLTPYFWTDLLPDQLTTSVEALELAFTYLDEQDLACLLQACPRLRTLKYDYWTTAPTRDPYVNGAANYTPDRSIPPYDWFNQCLQRLDFSSFGVLTTLHVPFELLVDKALSPTLALSLPPSLKNLWLNDDGARLWLNHHSFWAPIKGYHFETNVNPVYDPSWHPLHTDQEIIDVTYDLLMNRRARVPDLKTLRLIFYSGKWPCWPERDFALIETTLLPVGESTGVQVSVDKVHERPCVCDGKSVHTGQDPPYFTLDAIQESRWPEVDS